MLVLEHMRKTQMMMHWQNQLPEDAGQFARVVCSEMVCTQSKPSENTVSWDSYFDPGRSAILLHTSDPW